MILEEDIRQFAASIDGPDLLLLLDRMTKQRLEKVRANKSRVHLIIEVEKGETPFIINVLSRKSMRVYVPLLE
jgi:hypothetical protein